MSKPSTMSSLVVGALWAPGVALFVSAAERHESHAGAPTLTNRVLETSARGSSANSVQIRLLPLPNSVEEVRGLPAAFHAAPLHWTWEFRQLKGRFGSSLAGAGDVDGDGLSDLLVGIKGYNGRTADEGLVAVLPGTRSGFSPLNARTLAAPRPGLGFGHLVGWAGDINRDGFTDLFVAGFRRGDSVSLEERLFLFAASPTGLVTSASWEGTGPHSNSVYAASVASAGDVNGDGFADLVVGARDAKRGFRQEGAAFIHYGSISGFQPKPDWEYWGGQANARFGTRVCGAGDVNGDGFDDLLVGSPSCCESNGPGRVWLFLGSAQGMSKSPALVHDGEAPKSRFGEAIVSAGDLDRDGRADVVISAPGPGFESDWHGMVLLLYGSSNGLAWPPTWTVRGDRQQGRFGSSLAVAGDVDGDGFHDLVIGGPFLSDPVWRAGAVYLFRGSRGGFGTAPEWIAEGRSAGDRVGEVICRLGDINHDGFADFAVGSPYWRREYSSSPRNGGDAGRVDVFFGSARGYRVGQQFPIDGTSSTNVSENKPVQTFFATQVWQPPQIAFGRILARYVAPALLIFAMAGWWSWRRWSLKQKTALEEERQRLARDLHDDLGSKLTRISVLTELVHRQAAQTEEGRRHAQILADTAREVLDSMEQVIWSVQPANDTVGHLVSFILQYAGPFFAATGIEVQPETPAALPARRLAHDLRKNIFLAVKEALNNVVKHSRADVVQLRIACDETSLCIVIEDNGRGLPKMTEGAVGGDGLRNMQQRMTEAGGSFKVENCSEGGTRVTLLARV